MRRYFHSLVDVLESPIAQAARATSHTPVRSDRVLKSTRLEDMLYTQLRRGDTELDTLEEDCKDRLPTFPALSRDIFQSTYSLKVRHNEEERLTPAARLLNRFILEQLMGSPDYPVLRAACEGRPLPAYAAAKAFVGQVADDLDGLMERAGGTQKTLDTLERLEHRHWDSMERLRQTLDRLEQEGAAADPGCVQKAVAAANQAQSLHRQVEAVRTMVQDSLRQNQDTISNLTARAGRAAVREAEEVSSALNIWGEGPDPDSPKQMAADMELVARVRQSETLGEIARQLGRLRELLAARRRNGYTYGRREKYTLELGGDLSRALALEFALLASPATVSLFLRKLQRKGLKQYRRREPVHRGRGDIICMLDESASAAGQAPWCKAVALALLDIAMGESRRFAIIHFSGEGDYKTDLFLPGHYRREDVLRAAETFLGGNTDYATPLREALRLMEREGFDQADLVFVTDGKCALSDEFLEEFHCRQKALGFQVTGILLDQQAGVFDFSLTPFCSEIYRTSALTQEEIARQLLECRATLSIDSSL